MATVQQQAEWHLIPRRASVSISDKITELGWHLPTVNAQGKLVKGSIDASS